jgi:hypothetical protein
MVDTSIVSNVTTNGQVRVLPELIRLTTAESQRIPSPGTQRALKAQTGHAWDQLVGPDADSADRIQTMIWIQLRRTIPDLRWDECDNIDVQIEEGALDVDPTLLAGSASSPPSAGSGD